MKKSFLYRSYRHSDRVLYRIQNGTSAQVVHIKKPKEYFLLERLLFDCWCFFDGTRTVHALIQHIVTIRPELNSDFVTTRVTTLVQDLEKMDFIEVVK